MSVGRRALTYSVMSDSWSIPHHTLIHYPSYFSQDSQMLQATADASAGGAIIKYVCFKDADFAKAVAGAERIAQLSLTELVRTREDRFGFGDVKPDKHIEAVLKALGTGTKVRVQVQKTDMFWKKFGHLFFVFLREAPKKYGEILSKCGKLAEEMGKFSMFFSGKSF